MLRLTVLLCATMFVTLLIAGEDKGQLRPGLAQAIARGDEIVVVESRKASEVAAIAPEPVVEKTVQPVEAAALIETVAYEPAPEVTSREVTPEPVFTLSALPATMENTTIAEPSAEPVSAAGDVWYVTANSVNVRQGPSTETSIVEKLTRGEAVTVTFEPGSEWALVTIEGDGLEGYVALRFLSPEAP